MVVVFIALLAIAYIINILKIVLNGKEEKEKEQGLENKEIVQIKEVEGTPPKEADDKELVAVIAAAIASSLGVAIPQIRIKTIRRINTLSPAWSEAGRKEQITNRL